MCEGIPNYVWAEDRKAVCVWINKFLKPAVFHISHTVLLKTDNHSLVFDILQATCFETDNTLRKMWKNYMT